MVRRAARWLTLAAGLVPAGCLHRTPEALPPPLTLSPEVRRPPSAVGTPDAGVRTTACDATLSGMMVRPAVAEEARPAADQLNLPPELPGGAVPPIDLTGRWFRPMTPARRAEAIGRAYPPLPPLGPDPVPQPGPNGCPLTLADLQRLAHERNPLIAQAVAAVTNAEGNAVQAGLPPNPTFGYEGDTINTAGSPGYQGFFVDQVVVTAGKLQYRRAVAAMDRANAEVALKRAESDLATQVRTQYFAVLVAEENMRVAAALDRLAEVTYTLQVEHVRRGEAAAYEPAATRAQAVQARALLLQARNRYQSAWTQLAAALSWRDLPPTRLAGRLDIPVPEFDREALTAYVLAHHTDVLTADNSLLQARYQLALARVTPVPDVDFRVLVQKDFTGPPFDVAPSFQVSVPVPLWDRNQGGILAAEANVARYGVDAERARNALLQRIADAWERYENNRTLIFYYRDQILPDQVRFYRGVYTRYQRQPAVLALDQPGYADVVVAQQTLTTSVTQYVAALAAFWQSVVDLGDLLQTPDLFRQATGFQEVCPLPE